MVVLLCYLDVDGILEDGLPDNGTFLTHLFGGLVKILRVNISAGQGCRSSGGDCVVNKFPAQFPVADRGLLKEVELLIMDVGPYCLLNACLGHMLIN
jgi:hypothetical protein